MHDYKWHRWKELPVPARINDYILQSSIYLYPESDQPDSTREWKGGGSGFLIGVPSKVDDHFMYMYAVTNRHVVEGKAGVANPSPVIRLNSKSGYFVAIHKTVNDWRYHPDDEDLAMCYVETELDQNKHAVDFAVHTSLFCNGRDIKLQYGDQTLETDLGPGDETFVVGRFRGLEGEEINTPSVRWGSISQMDIEPILNPLGKKRYAYLVETHSISGYSGSPVFAYIDFSKPRPDLDGMYMGELGMYLIGVDMGHWPIHESVQYKDEKGDWHKEPQYRVLANSAMMSVVPAARLWDLINLPEFVMTRENHDKKLKAKLEDKLNEGESIIGDNIPDITEEDFKGMLKKVSRKTDDKGGTMGKHKQK